MKVEKDQFFPADLLLLSSSHEDGICYVETMNFSAIIRCEDPNPNLYSFIGNFEYDQQAFGVDPSHILLRD